MRWLSLAKSSLVSQDALFRKRELSAAMQATRDTVRTPIQLREFPLDPRELENSACPRRRELWRTCFPTGAIPSRVVFAQMEMVKAGIPCRSSNSLVVARPLRYRGASRVPVAWSTRCASAAWSAHAGSAFEGKMLRSCSCKLAAPQMLSKTQRQRFQAARRHKTRWYYALLQQERTIILIVC